MDSATYFALRTLGLQTDNQLAIPVRSQIGENFLRKSNEYAIRTLYRNVYYFWFILL